MIETLKRALILAGKGLWQLAVSILGICGWLFRALMTLLTVGLICAVLTATALYVKVKPELDECREIAYDKLAQMNRQDFSMLSDTVIYDKNGRQIGLINAGHYEYVPIDKISLNIQNAYIAQEDRRFKSHTGVDLSLIHIFHVLCTIYVFYDLV